MGDLNKRFGRLVKAHRVRLELTQEELAERANISSDMVSKLEGGSSGASFRVVGQLADALGVDPAELFTPDLPSGSLRRLPLNDITSRLASLDDNDLRWLGNLIEAALRPRA